ncbi:TnsD family Tn7-like transposition protein [Thalassotalea sp. ND16A]|uniref:TnsD family Tn7-like transposition protein n=1 Tax=Thalassotalea sp. ND16A TaxID=1535422 RepID=UPI00051A7D26|nr:TnsD family Tn7-like transposition protein [Thalassotalea sp. ND16A]KGK00164.1 hypothetical protein ND16A_3635 [Thalassotalea sp. ND16A]
MIAYFPQPQKDELLTSLIARCIHQQGVQDDKVALDWIFGNRTIVPSPLLQGHIQQLLANVGHIWPISAQQVVNNHTVLPLFESFIPSRRYKLLQQNLIQDSLNTSSLRTGINASVLKWPNTYKICPLCWREDKQTLGYNYWRRLFQCPGVECCWQHSCYLIDTDIPLSSVHRHQFVGAENIDIKVGYTETANQKKLLLSKRVNRFLNGDIMILNWSNFYRYIADYLNLKKGNRIDHQQVANKIKAYWGDEWLQRAGLNFKNSENNWLIAMFRKHRRPFAYLQHFVVWQALIPEPKELEITIKRGEMLPGETPEQHNDYNSPNREKLKKCRRQWLRLLSVGKSLKQMRAKKTCARLYIWLYRYDCRWLKENKPQHIKNYRNTRVNWNARDREIVRQLIKIERSTQFDIIGPRRSRAWFANQLGFKSIIEKKLCKLPLCLAFFTRYSESVDEYQSRRLVRTCSEFIASFNRDKPLCEIEKAAGLSHQRIRSFSKLILQRDVPAWLYFLSSRSS